MRETRPPLHRSAALLIVLVALCASARAQATQGKCALRLELAEKEPALAVFRAGLRKLDAHQPAEALALFEKAYCAYPTPKLFRAISQAQLELGQCGPAILTTQRWENQATRDEKPVLKEWRTRLQAECATVTIRVEPPVGNLTVDGLPCALTQGRWTGTLRTGAHEAAVTQPGYKPLQATIDVASESALPQEVRLLVEREAPADSGTRPVVTPSKPATETTDQPNATRPIVVHLRPLPEPSPVAVQLPARTHWELWIPAGVAAISTTVAIAEGSLATRCPQLVPTVPDLTSAGGCQTSHATAANVAWGITGASVLTGATLWLVLNHHRPPPPLESHALRFDLGGNGVLLSGRF